MSDYKLDLILHAINHLTSAISQLSLKIQGFTYKEQSYPTHDGFKCLIAILWVLTLMVLWYR